MERRHPIAKKHSVFDASLGQRGRLQPHPPIHHPPVIKLHLQSGIEDLAIPP